MYSDFYTNARTILFAVLILGAHPIYFLITDSILLDLSKKLIVPYTF
jgi:hypothetical protein